MRDHARLLADIAGQLEVSPDARDLLDALWLAGVGVPRPTPASHSGTKPPGSTAAPDNKPARADDPDDPAWVRGVSVYGEQAGPPDGHAKRIQLPAAPPLAGARSILRALRPLRRRIPRPGLGEIDVEASVEAIARELPGELVLRRRSERAWSLQVIVDEGGAWPVLGPSVHALVKVLTGLGAWRRVVVTSVPDGSPLALHCGLKSPGEAKERQKIAVSRLRDPSLRKVTIILTDATRKDWQTGAFPELLARLAGPVAMLMTLPATLWHRTGLRRSFDPDDALSKEVYEMAGDTGEFTRPVALVSVDPTRMYAWARSLPSGPAFRPRRCLPLVPAPSPSPSPAAKDDGETVVRMFLRFASPGASRLALLLGWLPYVDADLIRIVRAAMVPEAGLAEEAEFLTSGLLRPAPGGRLTFIFSRSIAAALRLCSRVSDGHRVLTGVSEWLEAHWDYGPKFSAALRDPLGAGVESITDGPFAALTAELLEDLGGLWAEMVKLRGKHYHRSEALNQVGIISSERLHEWIRQNYEARRVQLEEDIEELIEELPLSTNGGEIVEQSEVVALSIDLDTLEADDAINILDSSHLLSLTLSGGAAIKCLFERSGHDDVVDDDGEVTAEHWTRQYTATLDVVWTAEVQIRTNAPELWTVLHVEADTVDVRGDRESDDDQARSEHGDEEAKQIEDLKATVLSSWNSIEAAVERKLLYRKEQPERNAWSSRLVVLGILNSRDARVYDRAQSMRNRLVHAETGTKENIELGEIESLVEELPDLVEALEEMTLLERLQSLPIAERAAELDDLISNSYDEITNSEEFQIAEGDTNATMFMMDEYSIDDVVFERDACRVHLRYSASGDQMDERMSLGDTIVGKAVAVIDDDGNVDYQEITASAEDSWDDHGDSDDGDEGGDEESE